MRKLLLATAAVALVAASANTAQAQDATVSSSPKFVLDQPHTWGGYIAGAGLAILGYHMIDTHQRAMKGEKFAAVSTVVIGGEEYAQLSSAKPVSGEMPAALSFASVFKADTSNVAQVAK